MKIPQRIKRKNLIYYLIKSYKNFAKYKSELGFYECFSYQDLGLLKERIKPNRKIYNRRS